MLQNKSGTMVILPKTLRILKKIRKIGTVVILHSTWDLFRKTNNNGSFAFSRFTETVVLFLHWYL